MSEVKREEETAPDLQPNSGALSTTSTPSGEEKPGSTSPANSYQVAGDHYKKLGIQHWDYVVANGIPYLEACAIKYLTRWRDKGGVLDLKKALHYVQKLIELEEAKGGS